MILKGQENRPLVPYFDTNSGLILSDGKSVQSAALGLAHEMGHAAQHFTGVTTQLRNDYWAIEDHNLKNYETPIAKELGEPTRKTYFDAKGVKDMSNATHFQTVATRSWWEYLLPWNWGKSRKYTIDHNIDS